MSSIKQLLVLGALVLICQLPGSAQIDMIIPEPSGISRVTEPITLGVPFSQGSLTSIDQLGIQNPNGEHTDAQFQIMSRWRDGSIRWVKCDFQANVTRDAVSNYKLITNSSYETVTDLTVEENDTEITVNTGPLRFSVSKNRYNLKDEASLDLNENGIFESSEEIISKTNSEGWVATRSDAAYHSTRVAPSRILVEEQGKLFNPLSCITSGITG